MENNQIFDLLIEHILSVYDENDDEILYNDITYKIENALIHQLKVLSFILMVNL